MPMTPLSHTAITDSRLRNALKITSTVLALRIRSLRIPWAGSIDSLNRMSLVKDPDHVLGVTVALLMLRC